MAWPPVVVKLTVQLALELATLTDGQDAMAVPLSLKRTVPPEGAGLTVAVKVTGALSWAGLADAASTVAVTLSDEYSSALAVVGPELETPPATSTLPLGSSVAVRA